MTEFIRTVRYWFRDERLRFSIEEAKNPADAKNRFNKGHTFSFGNAKADEIVENHGEFRSIVAPAA